MKRSRYAYLIVLIIGAAVVTSCKRSATDSTTSSGPEGLKPAIGPSLTIRKVDSPVGQDSRAPELSFARDGRVIMSWVEKVAEKRYALRFAMRDGTGWSEPSTVAEGDNWFVNWADFPSVISLRDGTLATHWLVKSGAGTYAYNVNISQSKDGGKTWSRPVTPHTDGTQTEHGFVSLLTLVDGRLGAVWVDGRALKDLKVSEDNGPLTVSMALRYATIDSQGKLIDEALLDDRICECCQTSGAMTSDGPIVAYRDRSGSEVRDIFVVRRQDDKWTEPKAVHEDGWKINACPVNGPSIAADGQKVAVGWYTEAGDKPRVQLAFSSDGGRTFGSPIQIDDGSPIGRVDVLVLPDGSALVCWMSGIADKGATKVRRVHPDGTLDEVSIVAETAIARSSGFPRIATLGNEVLFAWTESGKPSHVNTAVATLDFKR